MRTFKQQTALRMMRIWHTGSASSPLQLGGVNATIWLLAREQARLGQQVSLLLDAEPDTLAQQVAQRAGIELIHLPSRRWSFQHKALSDAIAAGRPDLVHMHSVFIPKQATLARELLEREIPYVVTPHGGLSREVLCRGRFKKILYSRFLEVPRCLGAAAIINSPGEEHEVSQFLNGKHPPFHTIAVPVEGAENSSLAWNGNLEARKFVFLGRFDVFIKGIDLLVDVARHMPTAKFHLYGTEDPKTRRWLHRIQRQAPANVQFHEAVYGEDKMKVIADSSVYLQLSRSESFGISIAEAMSLGVPCAITNSIKMATAFRTHNLGITLPFDPAQAAERLTAALADGDALRLVAQRAQQFAHAQYNPALAAQRHLRLYEQICSTTDRPTKSVRVSPDVLWAEKRKASRMGRTA